LARKLLLTLTAVATAFVLLFNMTSCGGSSQGTAGQPLTPANTGMPKKTYSAYPPMVIDTSKTYTATMSTNYGDIVIQLFPKDAPLAVNNFVYLSRDGFYNGVVFHRIMKGFMIQSGDPLGTGMGGPGYKFKDEPITKNYAQGTLAMANAGPNTNGSQFFITLVDASTILAKNYTIFGLVTTGSFDVVQKIGNVPVKASSRGEMSVPTVDVHINSIQIEEK
jgi:cyclophilin family peptidyl-prolyl cis-trans isomerase